MSVQFPTGATRAIQPGDVPDLNDGQLSRPQAAENITRGQACFIINGNVTIATSAAAGVGHAPFVPTESVDNSGGSAGDTEMSGVVAPQRVALTFETVTGALTLFPGDYVKISDAVAGIVERWLTTDAAEIKYARFLGIEAALLDRDASTPFDETLTPGVVPDQSVTGTNGQQFVGWFQLIESQAGT